MPRFHVSGYIRIPVATTLECRDIGEAVTRAQREFDELAKMSVKVLKEKAANLASPLMADGTMGVVYGAVSNDEG